MATPADIALSAQRLSPLERVVLQGIVSQEALVTSDMVRLYGNRQEVISAALASLLKKKLVTRKKDPNSKRGFIYASGNTCDGEDNDAQLLVDL